MIDSGNEEIELTRLVDEPSYFVEKIIGVQPFSYQKEFMDEDGNRKQFVAGRQVGKSRTCAWMAIHKAITTSNSMVLITAKSRRQASELFTQVKSELRVSELSEDEFGIVRDTRTEINFDNGSRIKVVPVGRDGENIRSFTADMIIVDEAAFIDEKIFQEVLTPMLAVTDGDFIIISTPYGKQGFFWEKKNDKDWFTKQVPSWDNPKIDDEFIEKQRQQLTKTQFKQEIKGQFDSESNVPFSSTLISRCSGSKVERETEDVYLGADLARFGDDLTVITLMDDNGNVFNLNHTSELPLTDSMGRIKHYEERYNFKKIVVDATGLGGGVVDTLKEDIGRKVEGYQFNSVKKKQEIYNNLITSLENGEITLPDKDNSNEAEKLYRQLNGMTRTFTNSGYARFEEGENTGDDYPDSLALVNYVRDGSSGRNLKKGEAKPFNMGSLRSD